MCSFGILDDAWRMRLGGAIHYHAAVGGWDAVLLAKVRVGPTPVHSRRGWLCGVLRLWADTNFRHHSRIRRRHLHYHYDNPPVPVHPCVLSSLFSSCKCSRRLGPANHLRFNPLSYYL